MLIVAFIATLLASIPIPADLAAAAAAQQGPPASPNARATQEAMAKLAFLVGRWEGEATLLQAPEGSPMRTIRQSEDVRYKIGQSVLLVEGTGRMRTDTGEPGRVVFEALATITWDPAQKAYSMRAFTERGFVNPVIEVKDEEILWGFDTPDGSMKVRYHIVIDERNHWLETGESSRDGGKTWTKMIEMDLERRTEATPES
jgi:hypothetical protein